MRTAGGYSVVVSPGERPLEHDTTNCAHCGHIGFMQAGFGPPRMLIFKADGTHYLKEIERCLKCFQFICPRAQCVECIPYLKKVDDAEKAARKFICL